MQTVASNPNAIGYASVASVKDTVKQISVEGVTPTTESIQNGSVIISANKCEGHTEITVKDNGVEIAPEHIDKIWTRFYRVDNVRNDEYGSSGLGLSMVKSIIELHGGEIAVKSNPGCGTEFRILM